MSAGIGAWVRSDEEHGQSDLRKQQAIEEKESYRWLEERTVADTTTTAEDFTCLTDSKRHLLHT